MSGASQIQASGATFAAGSPDWFNAGTLEPIYALNERYLEWLTKQAPASDSDNVFAQSTGAMRLRAARCLFLLVDLEFGNVQWWQAVQLGRDKATQGVNGIRATQRKLAVDLTRDVLTVAWHTARLHRHAAYMLLGLKPPAAEIIAQLSLREMGRVAERHFGQIRPRWEDRPFVWRDLLRVAQNGEKSAWREFHMQGLQLLAGDFAA